MAIEIKELRIRVSITETTDDQLHPVQRINAAKIQEFKSEIVRECLHKVMEKIKEKAER
ncbi:DUF5908 family protein [Flavobacterium sp.]|uniref:DUF5908 family protein n=1 Tax=Flavobacterium sp. TaxID=239 RepID=UPI00286B1E66|nr:DUF5908 family protein [Flavobacterium sp.]